MAIDSFLLSLGALIKQQQKNQSDSFTPLWSKFSIKFTMGITKGNEPKNRISFKKNISNGPSANLRPVFISNVTKVYVKKWSQKSSRTIRSGVFGIAKMLK